MANNRVHVTGRVEHKFTIGDIFKNTDEDHYILANTTGISDKPEYCLVCLEDGLAWGNNSKDMDGVFEDMDWIRVTEAITIEPIEG